MRESIRVPTYKHATSIPTACRIGPLLWTSPISPYERGTRDIPETLDAQFENLFANISDILQEAGATWEQIGKMEFFIADVDDKTFKKTLEEYWLRYFPNVASRPARHTIYVAKLPPHRYMMATFMAYLE